ncbi:AbiJ-NTD4 domain-containing protein [Maribacter sp. CXY002]|uniref:AbiJ-NTD4 domain-containing protein n=1 Tax=Maribacter luteocoastalis TaxID=3407671 RepID=UPI003B67F70B
MSKFSKKYRYDEKTSAEIVEDAPEWTRLAFIEGILDKLIFIDGDTRYDNDEDRPIGTKELHKDFSLMCRVQMEDQDYDSWYCIERLKEHIKATQWYYFYDLIELVGKKLKNHEGNYLFEDEKVKQFGFKSYLGNVNELFINDNVLWRLNENSELQKSIPEILDKALGEMDTKLTDGLEAARAHYKKSFRYLFNLPTDTENGIKEIVSAVESVGRTTYPKASTLGDVIKELKKEERLPKMLIPIVEKFYAFANAAPAVRHGSCEESNLQNADGEFIFYVGVSLTRYLIKLNEIKNNT